MTEKNQTKIDLPAKLTGLFDPYRYKIFYGGRGAAKSHSAARALLIQGTKDKHRILCCREFQNSINDSVHKLLADLIVEHKMGSFYEVGKTTIVGRNGTEFIFSGLRHNVVSIKSMEGLTRVWVEEAQAVTKPSWDILIPTIRTPNSEIWLTFNPELEDDYTYQNFVLDPPKDSLVVFINFDDNPWFPDVLRKEMNELKERDYKAYENVWLGKCRETIDGSIFGQEIEAAKETGRIGSVPYDKNFPVYVGWDLGYSDFTSLWFAQFIGEEVFFIDFYQNHLQDISHYARVLQSRNYVYDLDLLPHDAAQTSLGTGKSIRERLESLGRRVEVLPRLSKKEQIDETRRILAKCKFDADACAEGLHHIKRYQYEFNERTGIFGRDPLHNEHSHAADALISVAIGYRRPLAGSGVSNQTRLREKIKQSKHKTVVY
jgi:phage terminase large subunit